MVDSTRSSHDAAQLSLKPSGHYLLERVAALLHPDVQKVDPIQPTARVPHTVLVDISTS